ncbi:amidohydrolase [Candidatus Magnetomorum sp. HK-1]|nr:amidohydrolase [Candidatus Magnetomorum sp. HK-1]
MTQKLGKHLTMTGPGQFTLHGEIPESAIDSHVHLGVYATLNLYFGQMSLTGPGTLLENLREHVQDILLHRSQLLSDFPKNFLSIIKGIFNIAPLKTDLIGPGPKPVYLLTDYPAFFNYDQPAFVGLNTLSPITLLPQILSILKAFPKGLEQANRTNLSDYLNKFHFKHAIVLPIAVSRFDLFTQATFEACLGHDPFLMFCSVHPTHPDVTSQFEHFIKMGAFGFKFHPDFQGISPDSDEAFLLFDHCKTYDLPIQCHVGWTTEHSGLSQAPSYEKGIKEFPEVKFILSHMGLADFNDTLRLAATYENVYLETSGQISENIKIAAEKIGADRIIYGSDWPIYHPAVPISCVLDAFPLSGDLEKVFSSNIIKLLNKPIPEIENE